MRGQYIKKWMPNIVLLLFSMFFCFLALEIICRLFLQPHEKYGSFFIPDKKGLYVKGRIIG